jgi:cardiolipin synthase (CMP-forming)
MRWVPNFLTCVRIALTPLIVILIRDGNCAAALPVTVVAGLTDAADGYLARRLGVTGRLGAALDPIADKLLLTALYVSFGVGGLIPGWLVALVVARDVLILLMAAAGLFVAAIRDFPPTTWGKLSTVIQISATLVFLGACSELPGARLLLTPAVALVAIGTAWSGIHYVYRAVIMARQWRSGAAARSQKV